MPACLELRTSMAGVEGARTKLMQTAAAGGRDCALAAEEYRKAVLRFRAALGRARSRLAAGERVELSGRLAAVLAELERSRGYAQRILVRSDGRIRLVPVGEVDWIEAADNYVRLHAGAERHLVRETMAAMEARLDPARFARIHRSTIVNLARVRELQPTFNGEYAVLLINGAKLTLSRGYRDALRSRLGSDW